MTELVGTKFQNARLPLPHQRPVWRMFAETTMDLDGLLSEIGDTIVQGFDSIDPTYEELVLESQVHVLTTLRTCIRDILHIVGEPVMEVATNEWFGAADDGRSELAAMFVEEWNFWDHALLPALQDWVRIHTKDHAIQVDQICHVMDTTRLTIKNTHWPALVLEPSPARDQLVQEYVQFCERGPE